MNPFSDSPKRVVIPLIHEQGQWRPLYGGDMPRFSEGSSGELIVTEIAFSDSHEIERFQHEAVVELLPTGTTLWAKLSPNSYVGSRRRGLPPGLRTDHTAGLHDAFLVPFEILQPLMLLFHGTKPAALRDCPCRLADFADDEAGALSINQAYTRLSERFEPKRRSHTGNVFEKVFYVEGDLLRPLKILREREEAKLESQLFYQSGELPLKPAKSPKLGLK